MRLINSDVFKEKLDYLNYELYNSHPVGELSKEEKDTVSWFIQHIRKMVDNMPAENVISIEWLKKWAETNSNGEWSVEYRTVFNGILKDWKKEKSVKIPEGNYDSDEEYEEQMRCLDETNRCE